MLENEQTQEGRVEQAPPEVQTHVPSDTKPPVLYEDFCYFLCLFAWVFCFGLVFCFSTPHPSSYINNPLSFFKGEIQTETQQYLMIQQTQTDFPVLLSPALQGGPLQSCILLACARSWQKKGRRNPQRPGESPPPALLHPHSRWDYAQC